MLMFKNMLKGACIRVQFTFKSIKNADGFFKKRLNVDKICCGSNSCVHTSHRVSPVEIMITDFHSKVNKNMFRKPFTEMCAWVFISMLYRCSFESKITLL